MEMVTAEFYKAVRDRDVLMVRIMLKDSLLVDSSFNQFNSMVHHAEDSGLNLWISDEDDETFDSDANANEDLNVLLVQLVNCFSKKRVNYIKGIISKKYPPRQKIKMEHDNIKTKSYGNKSVNSITIAPVMLPKLDWNKMVISRRKIREIMEQISKKAFPTTTDILRLREAAQEIVDVCDKLLRK